MSGEANKLQSELKTLVLSLVAKAKGGITRAEFWEFIDEVKIFAVARLIDIDAAGPEKKAWAMAAVRTAFDKLEPYLPLPMLLQPFRWLIVPILRRIVLAIADGSIEAIYTHLKETGAE